MSTPPDSGYTDPANQVLGASSESLPAKPAPDPNNPPWGLWLALLTWVASVVLIIIVPQLCALPYIAAHYRGPVGPTPETILSDKTVVLLLVIGRFVADLVALALLWAVVTRLRRFPFWKTLGFSWPSNFGVAKSALAAIFLLLVTLLIIWRLGGQETEIERILRSSRAAALVLAFIAATTAPLVEEVVYRGLLYSALHRLVGPVMGVIVVTLLFAVLHVPQYWPNFAAIASISFLSLALTTIRARTGRLLPCYFIHLIFNGIQSILIVLDPYIRLLYDSPRPDVVPGLIHSLLNFF